MNHPTSDELGLYLFGEAPPELNTRLQSHLRQCQACNDEVRALRQTMGRLDAWSIQPVAKRTRSAEPILKLAVAAALVLGIGIGFGHLTASRARDVESLRAQLKASIAADLARERANVAAEATALVAAAEARLINSMETGLQTVGRDIIDAVDEKRIEDRRLVQTIIDQLKQQRDADYVSLRRDLETVASSADQQLRQARMQLIELAADSTSKQ